jgi:serine/threonine protein kinase
MALPQLPSDDEIVAACREHSFRDEGNNCFAYPSRETAVALIKYDDMTFGIKEEARNQEFAYQALQNLPEEERRGIQIPKIYRLIERGSAAYIVMEYVRGKTLAELKASDTEGNCMREAYDQIERAIKCFLSFKVPDHAAPGPVGGGIIRHPIFKDTSASIEYASVDKLQGHLTKVGPNNHSTIVIANWPQVANIRKGNNLQIDFTGEDLCFCFSDLFEGNFIFTDTGNLCVVDFNHVSFLPTSFMAYAFDQPRLVCAKIKDRFDLSQANLEGMRAAGYYFMISTRKIGKNLRDLRRDNMLTITSKGLTPK